MNFKLKPVDQQFVHDPENGSHGDCHRACIATILGLPRSHVPHFNWGGPGGEVFHTRVQLFLSYYGLQAVTAPRSALNAWGSESGGLEFPYIAAGTTLRNNGLHSVVAVGNNMVHDPHPSRWGLVEAPKDWEITMLVPLAHKLATGAGNRCIVTEVMGQELYESWEGQPGYRPWTRWGNSDQQELARVKAMEAVTIEGALTWR